MEPRRGLLHLVPFVAPAEHSGVTADEFVSVVEKLRALGAWRVRADGFEVEMTPAQPAAAETSQAADDDEDMLFMSAPEIVRRGADDGDEE